jgi:methionyl-tRNA formyltransferase
MDPVVTDRPRPRPLRVAIFGMRCGFTDQVVAGLMESPDVPGTSSPLRVVGAVIAMPELGRMGQVTGWQRPRSVDESEETTVVSSRSVLRDAGFRDWLTGLQLDAIVVACFPWKLPPWLCGLPALGCLNVHPSLLPDGHGPEPLFWAFRWGLEETGVTVHLVDEGWDTGPIVAQQKIRIATDATVSSLEGELGRIGGVLTRNVLVAACRGPLAMRSQPPNSGRYAPNPGTRDLSVDTAWTASSAFRFMRAVIPDYGPVTATILATGQRCAISGVIAISADEPHAPATCWQGESLSIGFVDGRLGVRLAGFPGVESLRFSIRRDEGDL